MQSSNAPVSKQFQQFYPKRFVFSSLSASFAPVNSLSLHVCHTAHGYSPQTQGLASFSYYKEPRIIGKLHSEESFMRIKLLVTSFLLLIGCTTVQNISPPPIAVPAGLTENDVKLAILMAIANRSVPPKLAHGEVLTDGVVKALFQQNADARRRDSWHLEGMESSVIYAGYENRVRSMNVAVRYDERTVTMEILDSRRLKQSDDRIHKRAFALLKPLEHRVQAALRTIARRDIS
jgi:hypothetical protein